ncbi:MAG: tRNA uridine-5-carboxymethylaminomethyl(34) synthesis GTPase MnmE [Microbacter sp.]
MNNDTICALATASGQSAIAIVRISGEKAFSIVESMFIPRNKAHQVSTQATHTAQLGDVYDAASDTWIDEVLLTVFRSPHSYTGEDSVEISCHGSSFIVQQVLNLLIQKGCRMAAPGEFTQRAFLNGKMDLSQAEAVADLIASESAAAHRLAMQQLKGEISKAFNDLRDQLLQFTALIELELDFSEEDVEFANREQLKSFIHQMDVLLTKLIDSFRVGNAIKKGIPVAIIGETNVGKSTLLNRLVHEERALVSDIHGTTRDSIEETMILEGVQFRFIDTAGIRDTNDQIEHMGIERTFHKIAQASVLLIVLDATQGIEALKAFIQKINQKASNKKSIFILNKADKIDDNQKEQLTQFTFPENALHLFMSAKTGDGIDTLEKFIVEASQIPHLGNQEIILSNVRHQEALQQTQTALRRALDGLNNNRSGEFISQDIREAIFYLGTITGGAITPDEVLGAIFSKFCIGK